MTVRQRAVARPAGSRTPRVSVVVPCYNYGHYLPACINSIVSQPGVEVDVLVLDDASPDGSGDVADALAAAHRQVRVIRHQTNMGHIATYNEGLAQVDGDYVVLLSADDVLAPGALGRATALMEAHPNVGLVYGNPRTFVDVEPVAATAVRSWSVWPGPDWIRAQFRRGMSIIYSPEAVVRTSIQHKVGGYLPELPHSGDLEMWLRIAAIADVGRVNGPDQAFRREHPGSMMHTLYGTVLKDLQTRDEAYETFLQDAGKNLPNAAELRELAQRRMAQEALDWACSLLASADPDADGARSQEILECVEFAKGIYPGHRSLLAWRDYQLQLRAAGGVTDLLAKRLHAIRRDLKGRIRWQRWYRLGV